MLANQPDLNGTARHSRQPINGDPEAGRTASELVPAIGPGQAVQQPAGEALLITAEEAGRLLSVSVRTIVRLTTEGKLPAVKIGRATRYAVADVRAYVRSLQRRSSGELGVN